MKRMLTVDAFLIVILVGTANAHLGDTVFPIYELPTADLPDLHDGTLADWEEVLPAASLDQHYFLSYGGIGVIDASNLAWRVFLAWHLASQRIYMAIERLDDVYVAGLDGTQLRLDGDHSGGQYAVFEDVSEEEGRRLSFSQAQIYNVSPELRGDRVLLGTRQDSWDDLPPWADAGGFQHGESPNLSVVEYAVTPWDDLDWQGPELSRRSTLEAGRIIGFEIHLFDADEETRMSGWFRLALPVVEGEGQSGSHDFYADNFVDGELIPCFRGDCSGATTAVSQDSWGRIKASFR